MTTRVRRRPRAFVATIAACTGLVLTLPSLAFAGDVTPVDQTTTVMLEETTFGGPYSFHRVDFVSTGATAQRLDDAIVLEIGLRATPRPRSVVGNVRTGQHWINTDLGRRLCDHDAPELYGKAPVDYSLTCSISPDVAELRLELHSERCMDGCSTIDHAITIEPDFIDELT